MNRKTSIPLEPSSIHLLCCKLCIVKSPRWTQQELRKMSNDDHTLTNSFSTGGFGAQDTSLLPSVGGELWCGCRPSDLTEGSRVPRQPSDRVPCFSSLIQATSPQMGVDGRSPEFSERLPYLHIFKAYGQGQTHPHKGHLPHSQDVLGRAAIQRTTSWNSKQQKQLRTIPAW